MAGLSTAICCGIGDFFVWWASELQALLPKPIRRVLARQNDELVFWASDARTDLFLKRSNALETLATINREETERAAEIVAQSLAARRGRRLPVTAVLARDQYLSPRLALPLAAAEAPREAVRYQVSRISPFREDDVLFDVRVLGKNAVEKTLDVEVVLVPKQAVEVMRQRAAACGLALDRIALAADSGDPAAFTWLDAAVPPQPRTARKALDAVLAAVLLLLVGASVAWPLWEREKAAERLRVEISAIKPKAEKAAALRRDLDGATSLGAQVADARRKTPLAIYVLTRVSDILPDDAWLTEYRMDDGRVTITGYAPDATALLPLIEAADEFASAKFSAATSREQALARDRFSISFAVVGPP